MSKREAASIILVVAGVTLYLAQNFYFGWNREAQSIAEHVADWAVIAMVLIGFIIKPVRQEYHRTDIHTQNVEIIKPTNIDLNKKA